MSNFTSTIPGLVAHTVSTDKADKARREAIARADGTALKVSVPDSLFALRADGFKTKGSFTKGQRTEGSKVQKARDGLIQAFVEAGKSESSGKKWWNRLVLIATDYRFKKVETREAFWTKLEEAEVDSMRALDALLRGPVDLADRAEKQARELLKTLDKLSEDTEELEAFVGGEAAGELKAIIG